MTQGPRRALAVVMISVLGAAGCTSSHPSKAPSSTSPARSSAGSTSAPALPSGVTGATDVPASVPNKPAWRQDATVTTCRSTSGGWSAGGSVHNPGKKLRVYRVTVFFTTTSATVVGVASARVRVPAGADRPWRAIGHFTAPPKTLCVLRGVG